MEKKWWTLVAVSCGVFMLLLDITIVTVALPSIEHDLHATFSDLQWVVDAYALTLAALLLTTGSLADLFGRRLVFAAGLGIFTVGSLLCGTATSPLYLIVARSAQGIGGAAMLATSLALLAQAFRGRDRAVAFAVWGSVVSLAIAVGPLLGGILTTDLSWRWIFFVNVPIGVVALLVTVGRVAESRQQGARRPDWAGFAVFTACLVALVYGLIRASLDGWTDTGVLLCLALAAGLAVAFVVVERVGHHPMFDLALFRVPTFDGGLVASFAVSASLYSLLLYLVLYLQDGLGFSALGTGLRLLVISGATFVTSALAGRLTDRVPVRWLIAPGLLLVGIGLLLMTGIGPTTSWMALVPGFAVAGLGSGLVNPPLASTAVGVVQPERAGMASGINNTFRQVGVATGIAALGSIFATRQAADLATILHRVPSLAPATGAVVNAVRNGATLGQLRAHVPPALLGRLQSALRASFVHGLTEIFAIGAAVALAGAVAALLLVRNRDFVTGAHLDPADRTDVAAVG